MYTQDKHYKGIEQTKNLAQHCLNLLKVQMAKYTADTPLSIQYFKSIATIRFCLSKFADFLCEWCENGGKVFPEEWLGVLNTVEDLYESPKSKHPTEYFIKYIVRQHGVQSLNKLKKCNDPSFKWIIPKHLNDKSESVSKFSVHYYNLIQQINNLKGRGTWQNIFL